MDVAFTKTRIFNSRIFEKAQEDRLLNFQKADIKRIVLLV
jgi:hypothetical protein